MINEKEVMTKVATNLAEDAIVSAWQKIRKFFKDINAQDEIRYGTAYNTYLANTKNKYSKIKTLIYRHSPQYIYSFYECIGVKHKGKTINTSEISNLIDVSNKIIITGTGGIGKSMLFKHLYLNTIETLGHIPVLIELRSFNMIEDKDISLFDVIYNNLCTNGFSLEKEYFEYSLKEGGYIILLDGYDEIRREKRSLVNRSIRDLSNKYPDNHYFISSRPSEEFIGWNDFSEMSSLTLTKEQALSLIQKIEFDPKVKETFYKELESTLYDKYESFASNPLLLTIMLLTFSDNAYIPDKLNDFYEQAFSTLYNMHDATKEAYVRDIRSGLGCEDFKGVFSYICFKSYFKDEYEFTESKIRSYIEMAKKKFDNLNFSTDDYLEDLTSSVCMLVKEGLSYRFSHRSFQEYFAALYTCKLTDDLQRRILVNWIKESSNSVNDMYFSMLYNLQSEKLNKIILIPGLKEIQKLYNDYGYSIELLSKFFKGVDVVRGAKKCKNSVSLIIDDEYLCRILILNSRLNNYIYTNKYNEISNEVAKKLDEEAKKQNGEGIKFENALRIVDKESLLEALRWFESQVLFGFEIINKYENVGINKKRKLASIIDEL